MYYAFICSFGALSAILLTVVSFKLMQILQLSSYRLKGVIDWFKQTKFDYMVRYFSLSFFSFAAMLVYVGCFGRYKYIAYLGLAFYLLFSLTFIFVGNKQKSVTPLKFTPRIVRLTLITFVLSFFASSSLLYVGNFMPIKYCLIGLLPVCTPLLLTIAYGISYPFEALNNMRYVRSARRKLARADSLLKVGITGSYGKTTCKNILAAMLKAKYNVLATPASYNTPLGIARTVNYKLDPSVNAFVAEMGARRVGDIAELAAMVSPDIGIVTAVGAQHLATFGSIDKVAETKYELVEGLGEGGTAILSADNEYTAEMYERAECKKILAGSRGSVTYSGVSFSEKGTTFTLSAGDKSEEVTTVLLGRHIPSLIALCAAAALEAGVEFSDITEAVRTLEPIEHRLQPIVNGEITVLDDAYNSNAAGARNALEVLASFGGTRIVITPGLVEMGDEEENANYELGREVAKCADYAYFVGARAEFLQKGAVDAGMDPDKITLCKNRDEAVIESGKITGRKTVLFENDLPDNL